MLSSCDDPIEDDADSQLRLFVAAILWNGNEINQIIQKISKLLVCCCFYCCVVVCASLPLLFSL